MLVFFISAQNVGFIDCKQTAYKQRNLQHHHTIHHNTHHPTCWLARLIPLSATEHATQLVYPILIFTLYCKSFILTSHQHSPSRSFNSTSPHTVDLRTVKQTCELHLSNDCKQTGLLSLSVICGALNINCYILL